MKVCLICHFSSREIRSRLRLTKAGKAIHDFAAWNIELIKSLASRDDIKLYVISPHYRMKSLFQKFNIGNVRYFFYKPDLPLLNRGCPKWFNVDYWTRFFWQRKLVQHWVRKINPDIVNLIGAENPHYSSMVLGLKGYPVLVSIQGIYSNPLRFKSVKEVKWRSNIEKMVLATSKYFGVNANFMPGLISKYCKNPIFLWNRFPTKQVESSLFEATKNQDKIYDFVQFSGLTDLKGVPDTIKAAAIVREKYPGIKVRLFGRITDEYLKKIRLLIDSLNMTENVVISSGYETVDEMLLEAAKARFYILPTKIDTIPCTIFEATKIGLPVVSYKTGDIPLLNTGDERVLLCNANDIDALAGNMIRLLAHDGLAEELNNKTKRFIERFFSNEFNVKQFVALYHAVIENYKSGVPVPESLKYERFLDKRITRE